MGGNGSTRWLNHTPRRTVEATNCLDLGAPEVRKLLLAPKLSGEMNFPLDSPHSPRAWAVFHLNPPEPDGTRLLVLDFSGGNPCEPKELLTLVWAAAGFTHRWLARCPRRCDRLVQKIYLLDSPPELGCWRCSGLTHRSAQQHDARVDLADRDPVGFLKSRNRAPATPRSRCVTTELAWKVFERRAGHRTGRGWGIASTGIFDRMENPTHEEIDAVINIVPRVAAMRLPVIKAILDNANKSAAGASLTAREDVGRSKGGSD